jgi:type II secretory pathway pseudopilin PulG
VIFLPTPNRKPSPFATLDVEQPARRSVVEGGWTHSAVAQGKQLNARHGVARPRRRRVGRLLRAKARAFTLPELPCHAVASAKAGCSTTPKQRGRFAFTLLELLIVIGVISLLLIALTPALGPATGRSLDNSTRLFLADLESARLMAIAERTRTRVLVPVTAAPTLGQDLALRSYTVVSFNRTANNWKQRGKWNRLAQSVAFDPDPTLTDTATQMSVLRDRQTENTTLDTTMTFTGPYIEFRANGGTSLDPNGKFEVVILADAIADANGAFTAKNRSLRSQITIDPLSGSAASK